MDLYLGGGSAEKESGCIQRLRIKIREDRVDQLLHIAVSGSVGHEVYWKKDMELRTSRFAVLLTVVEAAVMDRKLTPGKAAATSSGVIHSAGSSGMIVIAVHWQAVAADEVITVAVMVFILRTHIIVTDSGLQAGLIRDVMPVRIGAVTGLPVMSAL